MITEPENSLISIDGYDFIENEEEDSQFNTMREINKSPTKSNSCIM